MQTVTTPSELRTASPASPTLGFVPSIGYLHAGHGSLAKCVRAECASLIASLLVNPTQFGPTEDLTK